MATPTQILNEVFNTNYPIDKIVGVYTGSFVIPGFDNGTFTSGAVTSVVTHNQNKLCLPELIWSPDGTNYYDAGTEISSGVNVAAGVNLNTATVYGYNNITVGSTNANWILYLLWPL